ncbi:HPr family phosphocarrier protein [Acuticoccus mangrovi]|uniref:Phosphocarrier protein HPr n=1 Tax=Acuticoccus mangrovi TaxID=2796142 RepID=A0A934ILJ0_9HYPH|nr:HPr family phosphocarrier protein [Acuticoccus mangrovi]MBJ3774533.1 HPr family phosphocarrier protein [Acuticoccus mangrovi]
MTDPITHDAADWVAGDAVILDPTGLHARPAVKLTKLAKTFAAAVEVRADGDERWVNAKSPNSVMKMKAAHGVPLHIRANGDDAADAVAALVALVERNFDV